NVAVPGEFDDSATDTPLAPAPTALPNWSCCCTVIGPSVVLVDARPETAGVVKAIALAAAAAIVIPDWLPVIEPVEVSVALNILVPPTTVLNVALKLPAPAVSVESGDSTACGSFVAARWMVPA